MQNWLQEQDFGIFQWPSKSPDLNPIEHLWAYLKDKLKSYPDVPSGVFPLWERTAKEWKEIPVEVCQNLIESMPRRLEAVIKAKGGAYQA